MVGFLLGPTKFLVNFVHLLCTYVNLPTFFYSLVNSIAAISVVKEPFQCNVSFYLACNIKNLLNKVIYNFVDLSHLFLKLAFFAGVKYITIREIWKQIITQIYNNLKYVSTLLEKIVGAKKITETLCRHHLLEPKKEIWIFLNSNSSICNTLLNLKEILCIFWIWQFIVYFCLCITLHSNVTQ